MHIEVHGVAEFRLWDEATSLEEAVQRVLVVLSIRRLRKHGVEPVGGRQITACGRKTTIVSSG